MNLVETVLEKHSSSESKLTAKLFMSEDEQFPLQYVLLEGTPDALRFLADFILAHIESDVGCNWDLHPQGAGSIHFSTRSNVGIYLHKLPCDLHPEKPENADTGDA